jgi:hypothetical protein
MFIIVYSTTLTLFRIYFRNIPLSNRNSKERPEEALHRAAKKNTEATSLNVGQGRERGQHTKVQRTAGETNSYLPPNMYW